MKRLQLSYAGHLSDRVQDLYHGTVQPESIDLYFLPLQPVEAFNRMLQGEFHCGEMSFSSYTIKTANAKAENKPFPFVAIPAFPSRTFRHSAIYIGKRSGITRPEQLSGRKVGVPEYQMTAAVWARGMLQHEYGVKPESIEWVTGGLQNPGRRPMVNLSLPGIRVRHEEKKTLNDLLLAGEIDAIIAPQMPPAYREGRPEVGLLFPDYPEVEREYYRKTRLFPIMHVVVLRRDLYEEHPWAAVSLYKAFEQARANCMRNLEIEEPLPISMPWIYEYGKSIRELMGPDYWPYGIEKNRREIDALREYTFEQGLVPARVEVEDLFAQSVVNLPRWGL